MTTFIEKYKKAIVNIAILLVVIGVTIFFIAFMLTASKGYDYDFISRTGDKELVEINAYQCNCQFGVIREAVNDYSYSTLKEITQKDSQSLFVLPFKCESFNIKRVVFENLTNFAYDSTGYSYNPVSDQIEVLDWKIMSIMYLNHTDQVSKFLNYIEDEVVNSGFDNSKWYVRKVEDELNE